MCAPVRNDRIIDRASCLALGFVKSARQQTTERQSERMRAVMRGDGAKEPFRLGKRFFQYLSCQAQERYWAQRSVRILLGRKNPTERTRFFFFPFFLFLAKERMGEERKTPSKIASLCFSAPPSAEPAAACFATPPARQRSGGKRMISAPTRGIVFPHLSFRTSPQAGEKSFPGR